MGHSYWCLFENKTEEIIIDVLDNCNWNWEYKIRHYQFLSALVWLSCFNFTWANRITRGFFKWMFGWQVDLPINHALLYMHIHKHKCFPKPVTWKKKFHFPLYSCSNLIYLEQRIRTRKNIWKLDIFYYKTDRKNRVIWLKAIWWLT